MISVTTVSSYTYCKRKVYLNQVLGLREPPKPQMILGSVAHEARDSSNKKEQEIIESIEVIDKKLIEERFTSKYGEILRETVKQFKKELNQFGITMLDAFEQTWQKLKKTAQIRSSQVFEFASKKNLVGKKLWEEIPKITTELRIESSILGLKGIIDRIETHDELLIPVELKTGSMPFNGVWPGHQIQLAAYMLLLEEHSKQKIKEAHVHYLDYDAKRTIVMNPFLRDKVKNLISEINEMIEKKQIPEMEENTNKCKNCSLKEQCQAQ